MRLVPDKVFQSVTEITPELLRGEGAEGLVLDLDNTLAGRRVALPDSALKAWAEAMRQAGIRMVLLSNNHNNRVELFAQALGLPFLSNAVKPLPWGFRRALRSLGLPASRAVAVGDQIFTDILGAHRAGMRAWLVAPIDLREPFYTRACRRFERHILAKHGFSKPGFGGEGILRDGGHG